MEQLILVLLAAVALLVRVGQALYAAGLSRSKNAAAAVMRAVTDFCVAALAYWAVGASILFQEHNRVFGFEVDLLPGGSGAGGAGFLFFLPLVLIATGAVSGAVAERCRFFPLCVVSAVMAGLVVPAAGNWVWSGWLQPLRFTDHAGASVFHVSAGVCAAVGALLVGPRAGKYNRDGSTNMIPGHNLPLAAIGVLLMAVGWVGYIAGREAVGMGADPAAVRAAVSAAVSAFLAAAAGGLTAVVVARLRYGKSDVLLALLGVLGGLVAVTAGGGAFTSNRAVVVGAVAGLLVPASAVFLDLFLRLDDPAGTVAVHGVGGAWGVLAAGLFQFPAPAGEYFKHLGVQVLGLVAIAVLAAIVTGTTWLLLRAMAGLRASEADEYDGLDLAEHDIGAYPDFQQTMIKSYHLREA